MIMKNNLKKVVITGGAGFIGSNLIRKLIEKDIKKILVIDDLSTGNIDNISEFKDNNFIEFVESRVEDCQNLNSLIEGYDFCFHLAAGVGVQYIMENVSKALLTNIEGTHKIIESCKVNGIPLLLTSTSEVYGVSDDPIWTEESKSLIGPPTKLRWSYAASKLIDEFLALSEFNDGKLNPIIVRLFNIIGNNQLSKFGMVVPKFIEAALENKPLIIHGDGTQTRSFTWVGDVVNYFYLLAEKQLYGEIFNIDTINLHKDSNVPICLGTFISSNSGSSGLGGGGGGTTTAGSHLERFLHSCLVGYASAPVLKIATQNKTLVLGCCNGGAVGYICVNNLLQSAIEIVFPDPPAPIITRLQ